MWYDAFAYDTIWFLGNYTVTTFSVITSVLGMYWFQIGLVSGIVRVRKQNKNVLDQLTRNLPCANNSLDVTSETESPDVS